MTPIQYLCAGVILSLASIAFGETNDILIADFEGDSYGDWNVEGEAFGSGPARGTLPRQSKVTGFLGKGLVNSFVNQDGSTGTLTSPPFRIERDFVQFLIGGGGHEGATCINLLVDGKVVRTSTGPNTKTGGSEVLRPVSWDVSEFADKEAVLEIVDQHKGGWGHINVDHIVQTDTGIVPLEASFEMTGTHLIVPVANGARGEKARLGIYDGEVLIQNFNVTLPRAGEPHWLAAYPMEPFGLEGKTITIKPVDNATFPENFRETFGRIRSGSVSDALGADDYDHPYRNQFHVSTRRGWNNDPNGMVYHDGIYHLYYQHNPFGIGWGNMHWGHWESTDLIHWEEKPIALYQKTVGDMAFSGGGFVDVDNTAGLGENTLFVAFTSTGRGECLAYSKDGGLTFTEIPENPVVKHRGRDPKIIWHAPEQKWVMAVYNAEPCAETEAVPFADPQKHAHANIAFWESKDLRSWTRTGAFTDPDRAAVFECPELFGLSVEGKPGESRWITYGAQNRYFIGRFDGKTFHKESGPHGTSHGAFYAAQTFSDVPDGRRIQVGWVRTAVYPRRYPNQIVNQAMTLPHEMTLRETGDGLRVFFNPVVETEKLRGEVLAEGADLNIAEANKLLQKCAGELSEVVIDFHRGGRKELLINGIDASFEGRGARIFTDRTFNEVYAGGGAFYEVRLRKPEDFDSRETSVGDTAGTVESLKIYRLKSIWPVKRASG